MIFDDVKQTRILNLRADISEEAPFIQVENVQDLYIENCRPASMAKTGIRVFGNVTKNIRLSGMDEQRFEKMFVADHGADAGEISISNAFE